MTKSLFANMKRQYSLYSQQDKCSACGMSDCQEAVDHSKVTLNHIHQILQQKLPNQTQILSIKRQVSQIYHNLKIAIFNALQKDQYQLQTQINKFNFQPQTSRLIDINLVSELIEQNISQLPSRKIPKLVKNLQKLNKNNHPDQLNQLKQKTFKLFQNFNIQPILQALKANLPLKHFTQQPYQLKLKPKTSISEVSNPEETDFAEQNKIYEWRNIRVTKNSRTVSLSNKNISDRQVMEQIPILANYKNLTEFQIRNNKISCLSCNLIANNMPFLVSVDIRGNNISDKGIIKLINSIPKLKSFFISETLATDLTGQEVACKLNDLQMFWSQHTKITNQVALKIAQKPKIKVLSLVGNPIEEQFKEKMKKLFVPKGYIAL